MGRFPDAQSEALNDEIVRILRQPNASASEVRIAGELQKQLFARLSNSQRDRIEKCGQLFAMGLRDGSCELLEELIRFVADENEQRLKPRRAGGRARAAATLEDARRTSVLVNECKRQGLNKSAAVLRVAKQLGLCEEAIYGRLKRVKESAEEC